MYLLDSCVCIDIMRGELPTALELMQNSSPDLFKIPSIVLAELEFGIEKSMKSKDNRFKTEQFLLPFDVLPFDASCARAYGVVREQLSKAGKLIGPNDMLIASMAIANQATLVTNNTREFKQVRGLRLESWREVDF